MKITATIILLFLAHFTYAQNIGINTTGSAANASAILDVQSTAAGMLLPRMTTIERDAIASPATSLLIFNTTTVRFEHYDGTIWKPCNSGAMILLSNSEADVTGVATTASVKSFVVPANIYSQIMVEAEIAIEQSGNTNCEWQFDLQYAGVTKATLNLKMRGNNASQEHKPGAVLKYSEAMTAGGTVCINLTAIFLSGLFRVQSLRVYGII